MTTNAEQFIIDQVRRIIAEKKEDDESDSKTRARGSVRRGKIGAGGIKADIRKAKAMGRPVTEHTPAAPTIQRSKGRKPNNKSFWDRFFR